MLRTFVFLTLIVASCHQVLAETEQPNIVLIIADDMGWKDVGYNGSEIRTPNLDELARSGVRLDRFYATPACSPTRASLMTGQSTARTGVKGAILHSSDNSLPLDLKLLPEFLREAGYHTSLVGKWHLGHARKEMLPMARGFDTAYGFLSGGIGHYDRTTAGKYDWHRDEVTYREEGYATHLLAAEAVRQIKNKEKSKPLYLHVAFSAPHLPNEAPEETIASYAGIGDEHRRVHAAMVDEMDQAIGTVLEALDETGIRDDTLVWFMSDNGGTHRRYNRSGLGGIARWVEENLGAPAPIRGLEFIRGFALDGGGDNGPYKGGKGSLYEGGILVPSIVSWPNVFPARTLSERVTVTDILPTLLSVASTVSESDQPVDGVDQVAMLSGEANFTIPDYLVEGRTVSAYFMDHWKLIRIEEQPLQLFDLENDPFESTNLADAHPDVAEMMSERLIAFPRAPLVNTSLLWLILDTEEWGGAERREPLADLVE